jgi:hypothetical protein
MSNASQPFAFSQFVPGFDFLKNLAGGAAAGAGAGSVPGIPSLASWVAPTLSVEEVDKRIQELKTVQYWLEQNGHALKATIQALEVQKMTLSTLRGMNVRMEDLASAFTRQATPAPAPAFRAEPPAPPAAPEPEPETDVEDEPPSKRAKAATGAAQDAAGVVDPLQWWGALTQQFQQIASSALQDASHLKMPQPLADAVGLGAASATGKRAAGPAAKKKSAPARGGATAAAKSRAPARKRAR